MTGVTVVTAPFYEVDMSRKCIFLAGGITDCPDWQSEAIELMVREEVTVLNPRQENFDVTDKDAAPAQIKWEYTMLDIADVILFWFPKSSSVQPIAMFELGRWSNPNQRDHRPIAVGTHIDYARRFDVIQQLKLSGHQNISEPPKNSVGHESVIYASLEDTVREALEWVAVL